MKSEQNIENVKIKINNIEVPLSIKMDKIEEPYYTKYLEYAVNDIDHMAQKIWEDREKEDVKNIVRISANMVYNAYSMKQMTGAINDIDIVVELNDGSEKVVSSYTAFITAGVLFRN